MKPPTGLPQLGSTIDTIRQTLPYLLQRPFPSQILSPQVRLFLYPRRSSADNGLHPVRPLVRGRLSYLGILRLVHGVAFIKSHTSGRQLRLAVLNEKMIQEAQEPVFVVRWQVEEAGPADIETETETEATAEARLSMPFKPRSASTSFHGSFQYPAGWFKFAFDAQGLLNRHYIESVEDIHDSWLEGLRAISVSEWLMRQKLMPI